MNPGLLSQQIRIERPSEEVDALGQPVSGWVLVGRISARRMKDKAQPETDSGDRLTERRKMVFRVRTRPAFSMYRPGDRLVELARTSFPEQIWKIDGFTEVDGTNGMYVDFSVSDPEER